MCKYCEGYKLIHEGDDLNVEQNNGIIIIHTNSGSDQHNPNYCYNCGRDLRIRPPKENTFTLKCNKCGSSTIIWCKKENGITYFKYNNQKVKIYTSNMEETFIGCKCGNEVKDS